MFSKIPEMSLNSNQTSSQSASLTRSQATGKVSSQRGKSGTDPQRKPGTEQQIKPGTDQANSVGQKDLPKGPLKEEDQNTSKPTKSSLTPNPGSSKASGTKPKTSFKETSQVSSSIVEEIDANVNRVPVSGLDGALVQARRYSITSTGRVKSPDPSAAATKATSVKVDQSPRRFSITSLPSAEQQHSRRSSISKAASAVTTNDPFRRSISIASSHSAERRFSASSPRSLTEVGQEEARRIGMESNQQRRRSSRETRRRASLILVGSNYRVGRKIGAGNFGEIRMGKNLTTDEVVAIKLEPMSARFSQLRREYIFYKKLSQSSAVEGIPSVYFWSTCLSYNALVMELLGPNLAELFELCNQKFTLKTVVLIALQTIRRIQFVHSKSILYRDVKPENFVIGRLKSKRQVIYLLDFGLAKEYIDPDTREHIPLKENKGITGTARYISINMHQGKEMSRRDDLEALGYMLLYFLKGRLPWQGQHLKFGNDMDTLNAVSNIKIHTSVEQLCQGYPSEFSVYLTYVRGLGFFDSPDYDFLSKLFQSLLEKLDIPCDWIFDWMKQELVVTPSGMLLTRLTDGNKVDGVDEPFVDRASAGEGGRFQSNKAMMSYDNLMMRDLSLNMSTNKEAIFEGQSPELHTYDTRKDKTGLSLISFPTKCIFCSCCGVCCIHKTNRISPI